MVLAMRFTNVWRLWRAPHNRHSCASLLLANGVPMKQILEWLGHSDFSTTANIYTHLDVNSMLTSAQAMVAGLKWPSSNPIGTKIHENTF